MPKYHFENEEAGIRIFVKELLDNEQIEDSTWKGVSAFFVDKGYQALSEKQRFVLERVLDDYACVECSDRHCDSQIPWSEMYEAYLGDGLCDLCRGFRDAINDPKT